MFAHLFDGPFLCRAQKAKSVSAQPEAFEPFQIKGHGLLVETTD